MATFRNYEPRNEGLNAAYEMLLQAELAKAQAMGNAFAPLTDAIRSGQQMKIARDEQARLTKSQAEDNALRTQRMGLDTRELDLREKQLNRSVSQDEAFARAMAAINGPEPTQPAASGVPFTGGGSAAMTQRPPLSAGGLLGQPQHQMDPGTLAAMGGENASRYIGIQNTLHDNMAQDRKYQEEQRQKEQQQTSYGSLVERMAKNKVLTPEEVTAYKMRGYSPDAMNELTTKTSKFAEKADMEARGKAAFEQRYKQAKSDFKDKPEKLGQLEGLRTLYENSVLDPTEREKQFSKSFEDLYGVGKEPPKEDAGPFKYITNRDEFKKGGFIGSASPQLQAEVEMEATMKAAELGKLRNDALILAASNPKYEEIVDFQNKMSAAEKDAVANFKKLIWATNGWSENPPGGALAPGASPREGLPYETGTQPSLMPMPKAGPSVDPALQPRGVPPEFQKKLESVDGRRAMVMDGSIEALGSDVEFRNRQEMDTFIKTGVLPQRYWK